MGYDPFKVQFPGIEEPSLMLFAPNKWPLFIHLAEQLHLGIFERQARYLSGREFFKWLIRVVEKVDLKATFAVPAIVALETGGDFTVSNDSFV